MGKSRPIVSLRSSKRARSPGCWELSMPLRMPVLASRCHLILASHDMSAVHTVDLNLLRVLDVLLEEENVTRAAARLELTQSALSRALARLRRLLGDELLLPTGRGMRPTARALELRPRVRAALGDVERLFSESPPFEPATARRRFRIAAVDYAHAVLLAPLLRAVATEAPAVDWELVPTPRPADRTLENGEVD